MQFSILDFRLYLKNYDLMLVIHKAKIFLKVPIITIRHMLALPTQDLKYTVFEIYLFTLHSWCIENLVEGTEWGCLKIQWLILSWGKHCIESIIGQWLTLMDFSVTSWFHFLLGIIFHHRTIFSLLHGQ